MFICWMKCQNKCFTIGRETISLAVIHKVFRAGTSSKAIIYSLSRAGTDSKSVIYSITNATTISITVINCVTRTNAIAIAIGDSVTWAGDWGTFLTGFLTLFCNFFLFAVSFLFPLFTFLGFPLVLAILVSS